MRKLASMPASVARRAAVVFTDIDDTLTTDGLLEAPAFSALWSLHDAGIHVVPVTGRPAGWCDHIARMWPVAGIIGENGAFYFQCDHGEKRFVRKYFQKESVRVANQKKLARLEKKILASVPGAAIASDQAFRMFDLAVDFCEDVAPLAEADIDRIVEHFESAGAVAKVSSIHVNGWFGRYDKLSMIKRFAKDVLDIDLSDHRQNGRAVYAGDSPNDEPAFRFFSHSVGVANVKDFADRLEHPPSYVTPARGGRGFAQLARTLIRARARTTRRS